MSNSIDDVEPPVSTNQLSAEDSKSLPDLCRTGKLHEVEKWISTGRPLTLAHGFRKSPLQVAVERQFHSLVDLLARHETNQNVLCTALMDAVRQRHFELAELLVAHGADVKKIPFLEVLESWDPKMIRFFIDHGADVITDKPFAQAFGMKIRTALRPCIEYRQQHPERASAIQEQISIA